MLTAYMRRPNSLVAVDNVFCSRCARDQAEIQRKRRTNRMLIAMVSIFVCCWLPLNAIILTSEYVAHFYLSPYFLLTFFGAHVVAMSSTVYNPFLYGWKSSPWLKYDWNKLLHGMALLHSTNDFRRVPVNPFLYGWLNDNFQKEFRILLPCLFTVFSGRGSKRQGIEVTSPGIVTTAVQLQTPRAETIRLQQLRTERNGCRSEEEKVQLVEATMDNVGRRQNNEDDSDADDS